MELLLTPFIFCALYQFQLTYSQHFTLATNQPHNITHAEYYLSPLKNTTRIHTCDLSGSGYKTFGYVCSMWHWGSSRFGDIMDGLAPWYGLLSLDLGSVLWLFWLYFLGFLRHFFAVWVHFPAWWRQHHEQDALPHFFFSFLGCVNVTFRCRASTFPFTLAFNSFNVVVDGLLWQF